MILSRSEVGIIKGLKNMLANNLTDEKEVRGAKHMRNVELFVKRAVDIVASALGLIALSPVILLIALVVGTTSRGPVFFCQWRLGKGGEPFRIIKFRTMVDDAEHIGSGIHLESADDPRITRVGKILRASSLDELPQLVNVLKGDMSLVGPRPPATYWPYDGYAAYPEWAKKRFQMRPGITGLVQISHEISFAPWDERIVVDIEYIDAFSISLDMRILAKTASAIFHRGAI